MGEAELIERIRDARKKAAQYRLLLGLCVLGVFAWYGWGIYQAFAQFDERFLLRKLNAQAAAKVWPALTYELEKLGNEVSPALATSFGERWEKEWPNIAKALDAESQTLAKNLSGMPDKVVERIGAATAKESKEAIAKAFPDLDPEKQAALASRVSDRIASWSRATVRDAVEAHLEALIGIKETLGAFRADADGEGATKAGASVNAQDVLELVIEVMDVRLAGAGAGGGAK